ncbi:Crp/Fnr family transcriptional regulator [Panacibacter ginsenosidivorans]|uniref:Crp/Fnr family transcriptional regulator n=1 Tax=Panacibacter ginsenosidivorans TaxID=1813871 RepID=A0A5B8V7Z6_9BACT|nr:Crp/Fnr family transcriptional regulator [Panacibacter ginsenosidivorans]QEC66498.1 Crp/Fnr family transcriptional regulator [Panacibacter ginsenosidivorans]
MPYELLLQNVSKHISLDEAEKDYFTSLLKERQVTKKELILKEGQLCRHINFVNTGILRAYYNCKDGKESTIMFAVEDWWITDMYCFINHKPAMLQIEAVENSNILQLQKSDLDKLYMKVPRFERFFRIIMQNAYIREQLRIIQNLSLTAEERYNIFLEKYPHVAKQVTLKQIASYLGITPEFLSMVRANKKK